MTSSAPAWRADFILYSQVDFAEEINRLTESKGVNVVYDSVGQSTFLKGFDCLKSRGMMVLYGGSSGPVGPFDPALLQRNSLFFARAGLAAYTATREELLQRSGEVFRWVGDGSLKVHVHAELPLKDAAKGQEALGNRETIGKVLLIP